MASTPLTVAVRAVTSSRRMVGTCTDEPLLKVNAALRVCAASNLVAHAAFKYTALASTTRVEDVMAPSGINSGMSFSV
jgi:hypothetical protein